MDTMLQVVDNILEQYHGYQKFNAYETHGLLFCSQMLFPLQDAKETGEVIQVGTHIVQHYN